jgi:lipopolysaccharide heptosyltransferase I
VKALVVRLSSIGDVVHTLPALAALHGHGWETGWIVEAPARPLLEGHALLSQVASAPDARAFRWPAAAETLRSLRALRYDVALDFQGLWKSAAWARLSGARRVIGYRRPWRREPSSALLVGKRVGLSPGVVHVIDKNLALLRALGIEAVGSRDFPLPGSDAAARRVAAALMPLVDGPLPSPGLVLLNPGGGWASKLWPAQSFGELARGLRDHGLVSVVTWGPGEEALAERVVTASGGAARKAFATTLLDYVELARQARLVVAADTGPLHLACAVGTPVVALFGPTDPARNGPFSPHDATLRRVPPCAPCHRRRCPVHEGVMAGITPAEALAASLRRLGLAGQESLAV